MPNLVKQAAGGARAKNCVDLAIEAGRSHRLNHEPIIGAVGEMLEAKRVNSRRYDRDVRRDGRLRGRERHSIADRRRTQSLAARLVVCFSSLIDRRRVQKIPLALDRRFCVCRRKRQAANVRLFIIKAAIDALGGRSP